MIFEGANGALGSVASMHVGRNKLIRSFPFDFDDVFVRSAYFVVEDLKVNFMAAGAETSHDGVVSCNTVLVFFSFEGSDKDGVGVTMICRHDVLVATARSNGKAASIIGVEF